MDRVKFPLSKKSTDRYPGSIERLFGVEINKINFVYSF